MKLTQIFTPNKDISSADRLEALVAIVKKAKAAYGNTDVAITTPLMQTAGGLQDMKMLSVGDKLAIAASEFQNIKKVAVEYGNSYEGASMDKKIEELLAISPVLSNIAEVIESDYL